MTKYKFPFETDEEYLERMEELEELGEDLILGECGMTKNIFDKSPFETDEEYLERMEELEEDLSLEEKYEYGLDPGYDDPDLDEMDELDRWLYFEED